MSNGRTGDAETVVSIRDVSRRFGSIQALDNVCLDVPRGAVFGLVGVNGAGKTTLLKHVLGLLKPESGSVSVFDQDPIKNPVGVLSQIGYLSEDNDLPAWMRIGELLRYQSAFYPTWDETYAEDLCDTFRLDRNAKIKSLSRGQRARTGLLVALAHHPALLVLDEPSSGLDPVVRRDILVAIIRTISREGRTVFFSSHLLDEVERVSDHVAMIDRGTIVICSPLDEIRDSYHRLTFRCQQERLGPPEIPGAFGWQGERSEWSAVCQGRLAALEEAAHVAGVQIVTRRVPSLDEIFVARAGGDALVGQE